MALGLCPCHSLQRHLGADRAALAGAWIEVQLLRSLRPLSSSTALSLQAPHGLGVLPSHSDGGLLCPRSRLTRAPWASFPGGVDVSDILNLNRSYSWLHERVPEAVGRELVPADVGKVTCVFWNEWFCDGKWNIFLIRGTGLPITSLPRKPGVGIKLNSFSLLLRHVCVGSCCDRCACQAWLPRPSAGIGDPSSGDKDTCPPL